MINIQQQQKLLINIAENLPRNIEAYAIGGTGMIFHGLKDSTLDVDIVFRNAEDRRIFRETALSLGFKGTKAEIIYGNKDNIPQMVALSDVRIDLFLLKIISSNFSEGMQKRATQIHEFADKLFIKAADPIDIIIMKSVTSRDKDLDDIVSIINKTKINWKLLIEESNEQVKLGNESAILNLGEKLEKLSNQKVIIVPKDILDKLWKLLNKQVKAKGKKKK